MISAQKHANKRTFLEGSAKKASSFSSEMGSQLSFAYQASSIGGGWFEYCVEDHNKMVNGQMEECSNLSFSACHGHGTAQVPQKCHPERAKHRHMKGGVSKKAD